MFSDLFDLPGQFRITVHGDLVCVQGTDQVGFRIEPAHAAIDGDPVLPVPVLPEEADAVQFGFRGSVRIPKYRLLQIAFSRLITEKSGGVTKDIYRGDASTTTS